MLALEDAFRQFEATTTGGRAKDKPESKLDDHEVAAVVMRLFPEAVTATTAQRRRMLAHALAGLLQPDLDSETRSRVTRAITQLEPGDVRELRKVDEARRAAATQSAATMTPKLEPLLLAGCILAEGLSDRPGTVTLTALGRTVLATLARWSAT